MEDPELRRARLGCAQGTSFTDKGEAGSARIQGTGLPIQRETTHFRGLEKVILTSFSLFLNRPEIYAVSSQIKHRVRDKETEHFL